MNGQFRWILRLTRGHRLRYAAAVTALMLGSGVMYLVPLVPQVTLDGVLAAGRGESAPLVRRLVEAGGGREFLRRNLWIPGLCVVGLTCLAGLLTYLRGRWAARASEGIARTVRDRLYDHIQHLPCAWHDRVETGDLVQRCTSDVETLRQFLATQLVETGRALFMFMLPIPLMLALDLRMTLVSVAAVPPILVFSFIFYRKVRQRFLRVDEAEASLTSVLQENLTGIRVVRAFARHDWEEERFDVRNLAHRELEYRLFRLMAWYWSLSDFLCMGQKAAVVGLGGWWLLQGRIPVGTFYFFLAAVSLFIWPIRMMGRLLTELGKATVAIGRIAEVLEASAEREPEGEPVARPSRGGRLAFENVTFYHGGARVLDGVSFEVPAGTTLAVVGPSGAGKTTLVHLLLRLYDPQEGRILLDGRDLATIPRKEVRARVATVLQEPFLYSRSLEENIRLGRPDASTEEVRRASEAACLDDTVRTFRHGYRTLVGERGVMLSGGQRQRVALARALLMRPDILVLDDALSAVDTGTEGAILEGLRSRRGKHTTVMIAHRLSTLAGADRVLVLDRGRIVQNGSPEELLRRSGPYRRLWESQEGKFAAGGAGGAAS